jgi:hypothetical protein
MDALGDGLWAPANFCSFFALSLGVVPSTFFFVSERH